MKDAARLPIVNYHQAVWRVAQMALMVPALSPEIMSFGVKLVADIFWLSDKKVATDVRKACKAVP